MNLLTKEEELDWLYNNILNFGELERVKYLLKKHYNVYIDPDFDWPDVANFISNTTDIKMLKYLSTFYIELNRR